MAAGVTYTPLATTTLSSTQSTVSFTSISSSYTDLVIVVNAAFNFYNPVASGALTLNSDTGSNYSYTAMSGDGSTAASFRGTSTGWVYFGECSANNNPFSTNIINVMNYSNTSTYKTILSRSSLAHSRSMAQVNLWRNTSAINRIDLLAFGGTSTGIQWVSGSTFTLYGITAA